MMPITASSVTHFSFVISFINFCLFVYFIVHLPFLVFACNDSPRFFSVQCLSFLCFQHFQFLLHCSPCSWSSEWSPCSSSAICNYICQIEKKATPFHYRFQELWKTFPNLTIHLASGNQTTLTITIKPQSYLRPAPDISSTVSDCWVLGIDESQTGTVLGRGVIHTGWLHHACHHHIFVIFPVKQQTHHSHSQYFHFLK